MKEIKLLAILFSLLFSFYSFNLTSNAIFLSGAVEQGSVNFYIQNTGASNIEVGYIVIQDDVLLREQDKATLLPGGSYNIQISEDPSDDNEYQLTVSIDNQETKTLIIQE